MQEIMYEKLEYPFDNFHQLYNYILLIADRAKTLPNHLSVIITGMAARWKKNSSSSTPL